MASASTNSNNVAVRSTFEGQGYNVEYDSNTGAIRVYDPKTGHSANIMPGAYSIQNGSAYISPDVVSQVTNTIQSGKYTYYPETSMFPNSPYTSNYVQNQQATKAYLNNLAQSNQNAYSTEQSMLNNFLNQQTAANQQAYQQNQATLNNYIKQTQANNQAFYTQQQQVINNYLQQMNNFAQQYGTVGLAILQQYQQQFQNAVDQVKTLMSQDSSVPQSVQLALDLLDKQLQNNIRYLNNEMNGRGLYNSSIALNAIEQAQTDTGNQKEQLLANWLDQQHQELYNATMQLAKMYEDYANNYANLQSQYATKPLDIGMQTLQNATNLQSNLNQQQWSATNDLNKNAMNFLTQIYNDYMNAQNDLTKTGFSVGMQIYDNFVNAENNYLQQSYQLPLTLQNQYIQNSANYEYQQQQLDLENKKLAAEVQKYLDDIAYKNAQLQYNYAHLNEIQRHDQAMENISAQRAATYASKSSGSSASGKALSSAQKVQLATQLVNSGVDPTTASYIVDRYLDTAGVPLTANAALNVLQFDKNNSQYSKVDFDTVYQVLNQLYGEAYFPTNTVQHPIVPGHGQQEVTGSGINGSRSLPSVLQQIPDSIKYSAQYLKGLLGH
jgi:hypothetical protein